VWLKIEIWFQPDRRIYNINFDLEHVVGFRSQGTKIERIKREGKTTLKIEDFYFSVRCSGTVCVELILYTPYPNEAKVIYALIVRRVLHFSVALRRREAYCGYIVLSIFFFLLSLLYSIFFSISLYPSSYFFLLVLCSFCLFFSFKEWYGSSVYNGHCKQNSRVYVCVCVCVCVCMCV